MSRDRELRSRSDRYRPPVEFEFGRRDHGRAESDRREFNFRPRYDSHDRPPPRFSDHPQRPPPREPAQNSRRGRRGGAPNLSRPSESRPIQQGRPNTSTRGDRQAEALNFHHRGGRQADASNSHRGRRPWFNAPPTSDRPLLRTQRAPTPDQLLGMNDGGARFKTLEELSNSEDDAMDLESTDETQDRSSREDADRPDPKRQKLSQNASEQANRASIAKWSNPDPYTSLPPPNETTGKRLDVVKLIRKAKAFAFDGAATSKEADDFISFASLDDNEDHAGGDTQKDSTQEQASVSDAPTNRKFIHLDNLYSNSGAPGTSTSVTELGPPPSLSKELKHQMNVESIDSWPPPEQDNAPVAGRKRTHDETTEETRSDDIYLKQPRPIAPTWLAKKNWKGSTTPWVTVDHSNCETMGVRLHKEICDFYDFVKPLEFENELRHAMVHRVSQFVGRQFGGDAEVAYFGSFAAGTYLPTADMDLVVLSRQFRQQGFPTLGQNKKALFKFARRLMEDGIAKPGSAIAIWKAKVPIVKYIDNSTGLRCDISFENSTGPTANRTYDEWKAQFPAMPVIVSLIKQFLLMRDLNEVHTGGLGSFAVTCLVVSLMQHMPGITSGNMDPMKNLGEVLMSFFDFYGNKFNQVTTGIQMRPPAYFPKAHDTRIKNKSGEPNRLCIIDPNRPDNDISGGTIKIQPILLSFAWAFGALQNRMNILRDRREPSGVKSKSNDIGDTSILSVIFGGSYRPFTSQRDRMRALWENTARLDDMISHCHEDGNDASRVTSCMFKIGAAKDLRVEWALVLWEA